MPQDPLNILDPGARNRILSKELPVYQLNSCLQDIVDLCGKKNDEEARALRLAGMLNHYREYRDSPLDPTVEEKLGRILSVTGVSKEYRFEFKLKQLEQRAALDALDSIDLGRGSVRAGLLLVTLNGALRSASERGQIQAPLRPPRRTAASTYYGPASSIQGEGYAPEKENGADRTQPAASPRIRKLAESTNIPVAGDHDQVTTSQVKSPVPRALPTLASASDLDPVDNAASASASPALASEG